MTATQATLAITCMTPTSVATFIANKGKIEAKELPNCSIPHLPILHLLRLLKSW